MSSRSKTEASVLSRLDPSRRADAMARAAARSASDNDAFKAKDVVETPKEVRKEPVLPGLNPMGMRASSQKAKKDRAIEE